MSLDASVPSPVPGGARRRAALPRATIVRRREVGPGLWVIWIRPDSSYSFKPGQYCTIGVDDLERAYSIASAPQEDLLELFIERIPPPEGALTPVLYDLHEGDEVLIRPQSKGIFTFEPRYKNHLMVATVTGVAPYVSMLRSLLQQGTLEAWNLYVLQGASFRDEFAYDDELRQLAAEHPTMTYVPTVSRPAEERNTVWTGSTGRVNLIVEKFAEDAGLDPAHTLVYACGHPGMIEDVKLRMGARGFRVKEERFWKD